jgi:anti-sigma B factor antagonist
MTYYVKSQTMGEDPVVVTVGGELDLYAAPEMKECLGRALSGGGSTLVIDMSEATFIDSTAIGVLVGTLRRVQDAGGSLDLVCTHEDILRVFEVVGLDEVFAIHETLEDAFAARAAVA